MSNSNYLYPKYSYKIDQDTRLQDLFEKCGTSLVYAFCKFAKIDYEFYEDETGIRFSLYSDDLCKVYNTSYFTTDGGFTYYVYPTHRRDELFHHFSKFKKLKAFL